MWSKEMRIEGTNLEALVTELECLPYDALRLRVGEVESLLSDLAVASRDATVNGRCDVTNARDLGARACEALLRLPITVYSESTAAAFWEVARFSGTRKLNASLVLELARRLVDIGFLLGSLEWRRKAFMLSSTMHSLRANYAVAMEHSWSALTLARAVGEPGVIAAGWNNLGTALGGAGMHQASMQCFEMALAEGEGSTSEAGVLSRRAALSNIALAELSIGHFERGLRAAEEAWRAVEHDLSPRAAASRLIGGRYLVRLLVELGNAARARTICDETLKVAARSESGTLVAEVEAVDGLCMVAEGRVAKGLAKVQQALETLRYLHGELSDTLAVAIRAHEFAGHAAAAYMYRRELCLHGRLAQQEGMLEQHRAHLDRLHAEEGDSLATLERQAEMVERLAITVEMREDPTGLCVFRVARLARLLAQELGWSEPDAESLEVAARLHDIGKISVADDIVAARRVLTADEMQAIRDHCNVGADLLRQTELENARLAADVAAYHHEAWDGSGYPHGIGGTAIPLAARIVAIADAFDAMTRERPYRPRLGIDEALARLREGAGTHHDPVLVPQFVALVRRLRDTVEDLDGYLTQAALRSPVMKVHRQLTERLAEPKS